MTDAACYTGAMQVIAGTAKGRRLEAPRGLDTRPLSARVKASLFDILGDSVEEAQVLDLFAGTGQLGIEALSRGANHATFVERGQQALEVIRRNLQVTGFMAQATVVREDVFTFVRRPATEALRQAQGERGGHPLMVSPSNHERGRPYSLIIVAPPQSQGMAARAVQALDGSALLADDALVVVQQFPKEALAEGLQRLTMADRRDYGSTTLVFYEARMKSAMPDV